jgi:hypothetical protein
MVRRRKRTVEPVRHEEHSPDELFSPAEGAAGRTSEGTTALERASDPRGAARTERGEVFRDSDFYPTGLPDEPER